MSCAVAEIVQRSCRDRAHTRWHSLCAASRGQRSQSEPHVCAAHDTYILHIHLAHHGHQPPPHPHRAGRCPVSHAQAHAMCVPPGTALCRYAAHTQARLRFQLLYPVCTPPGRFLRVTCTTVYSVDGSGGPKCRGIFFTPHAIEQCSKRNPKHYPHMSNTTSADRPPPPPNLHSPTRRTRRPPPPPQKKNSTHPPPPPPPKPPLTHAATPPPPPPGWDGPRPASTRRSRVRGLPRKQRDGASCRR